MGKLRDLTETIVSSWAFPALFGILSFFGWVTKFAWPFAIAEAILCFLPLITMTGRAYHAPLIMFVPIISESISFSNIPVYCYIVLIAYVASLVAYIAINRCKFKTSFPFFAFLSLILIFLISCIISIVKTEQYVSSAVFFVIGMLLVLMVATLNCDVMEEHKDSFSYLSKCLAMLSILISLEIFSYYIWNPNDLFAETFQLGWANTKSMVSTIMTLCLASYGTLIFHKKIESITSIISLIGILLLANPSGLLTMIIGFIPLILISFRSYGKAYPYISLGLCCSFVAIFAILLGYVSGFRELFIESIKSLNPSASINSQLYNYGIEGFKSNPLFGPSAQGLVGTFAGSTTLEGTITPLKNTLVTTLYMGGTIGLIAWIICEISVYSTCFLRKSQDKWVFLFMLLVSDFIGITDNSLFNLYFLGIYLLSISAFQNSFLYSKVKINDRYYSLTTKNNY